MADKTRVYVPMSSAKRHTFQGGGEILKLGFKADELIAFIQQHTNDRGWINLIVSERRKVGERGDTHSVTLDTFEPKQREPVAPADAPVIDDDSDIPFAVLLPIVLFGAGLL